MALSAASWWPASRWSPSQRSSYLVMSAGPAAYVPAFTNLAPREAGEVQAALANVKIPSKLGAGGTSVEVPSSQVEAAAVAIGSSGPGGERRPRGHVDARQPRRRRNRVPAEHDARARARGRALESGRGDVGRQPCDGEPGAPPAQPVPGRSGSRDRIGHARPSGRRHARGVRARHPAPRRRSSRRADLRERHDHERAWRADDGHRQRRDRRARREPALGRGRVRAPARVEGAAASRPDARPGRGDGGDQRTARPRQGQREDGHVRRGWPGHPPQQRSREAVGIGWSSRRGSRYRLERAGLHRRLGLGQHDQVRPHQDRRDNGRRPDGHDDGAGFGRSGSPVRRPRLLAAEGRQGRGGDRRQAECRSAGRERLRAVPARHHRGRRRRRRSHLLGLGLDHRDPATARLPPPRRRRRLRVAAGAARSPWPRATRVPPRSRSACS